MSSIEKLIERMKTVPRDFTYDEASRIAKYFHYQERQGDGSRVRFYRESDQKVILLHKPHRPNSQNTMLIGAIKDFVKRLKENGDIK